MRRLRHCPDCLESVPGSNPGIFQRCPGYCFGLGEYDILNFWKTRNFRNFVEFSQNFCRHVAILANVCKRLINIIAKYKKKYRLRYQINQKKIKVLQKGIVYSGVSFIKFLVLHYKKFLDSILKWANTIFPV